MSNTIHVFTDEEQATVLAALRFWQRAGHGASSTPPEWDIATNEGTVEPLDEPAIDDLCERINTSEDEFGILPALESFEDLFAARIENEEEMPGADTVEMVSECWPKVKAALEALRGKATEYPASDKEG